MIIVKEKERDDGLSNAIALLAALFLFFWLIKLIIWLFNPYTEQSYIEKWSIFLGIVIGGLGAYGVYAFIDHVMKSAFHNYTWLKIIHGHLIWTILFYVGVLVFWFLFSFSAMHIFARSLTAIKSMIMNPGGGSNPNITHSGSSNLPNNVIYLPDYNSHKQR